MAAEGAKGPETKEERIDFVVKILNSMGPVELAMVSERLEPGALAVLVALEMAATRRPMEAASSWLGPGPKGEGRRNNSPRRHSPNRGRGGGGGYGGGYGGKGKGGAGKRDTGSGKGREKGPTGPLPDALEQPEVLAAEASSGEQVAFQFGVGTPWQLTGPQGGTFRWDLQDRNSVSDETKQEVKEILESYASEFQIPLRGPTAVKLALRRGNYWVSWAGGISSVDGRPEAEARPPRPTRPAPEVPAESEVSAAAAAAKEEESTPVDPAELLKKLYS